MRFRRFDFWHALAATIYVGSIIGGALYLVWRIWHG
jgi:hypothetical protein